MSSTFYGGTVAFGYQHRICGDCLIGIEAGINLGSGSGAKVGGVLKTNSVYVQNEYAKRSILRQMLLESFEAFDTHRGTGDSLVQVVNSGVWNNFVSVLRYLGGVNVDVSGPQLLNFVTAPAHAGGVFNLSAASPPNPDATLRNFMGRVMTTITELGRNEINSANDDKNLLHGLSTIRNFITERYPVYAQALSHIADNDLTEGGSGGQAGSHYGGGTDLNGHSTYNMANFFRNNMEAVFLSDIGIDPAILNEAELEDVMNTIYVPTAADNAALALPPGADPATIRRSVKSKTSFGVCPYVALKVGYYFKEIKGCMFAKIGLIHLNGHVTPVNDAYGLQDEKFHKIAPFAAVEISHAFKAKKRLRDANFFGVRVENKTSISRTTVRLMATYRF